MLARERIAQEVLTGEQVEGPAGGDRPDLEVVWLLSDEASYLTGQAIAVDVGTTARGRDAFSSKAPPE